MQHTPILQKPFLEGFIYHKAFLKPETRVIFLPVILLSHLKLTAIELQ